MNQKSFIIFISAGESSGDMHGAELAKNIIKTAPKTKLHGLGGDKMENVGVKLIYNMLEVAVVGLFEVTKNMPKFIKIFKSTVKYIKNLKPDLVVLIDNPGFNLRLAKKIKKYNIPIVYYISPQVWAWGGKRIKKIKTLIDKMLVVFKFEEKLYLQNNINCKFVGHPLLDLVKAKMKKNEFKQKFGLEKHSPIIGLFPGSREKEIQNHLPTLLKSAALIRKKYPRSYFIIAKSPGIKKEFYEKFLSKNYPYIKIINNYTYDCINISDFCIVASGTATLETAILETPMIIIYKTSLLTYLMLKPQVKVPYIGMVNVIAGKKIVSEIIQNDFKPRIIADKVCAFLDNPSSLQDLKEELKEVKKLLGEGGASKKAAEEVMHLVQSSRFNVQS